MQKYNIFLMCKKVIPLYPGFKHIFDIIKINFFMSISAVIITKNEEHNIERCLQSLQGVVDEILVVDSFSTDATQEICERYHAKFFQQEWLGFAEQKNHANSLSAYDTILSIDADEALSPELQQSLLALKSADKQNFVCQISRLTNYCGKWIHHCGWYPDKKIRVFNRNTAKWAGTIHETLSFPSDTKVISLKGDLYHYSYNSVESHVIRANKYTTLSAIEAFEKGKNITFFYLIIKSCWKFFRDYFLKGGFLDGYYGYVICKMSVFVTLLEHTKLKQLHNQHDANQ